MMNSHDGLYAYGLVGKLPKQLDILGIDKKNKVYSVSYGDIYVVVSKLDIDIFQKQVRQLTSELTNGIEYVQSGVAEILQAHEDVVHALIQDTTVIPLKFGTILKDETAALKMLQDREEFFKNLLAKLAGKLEWGLKVYSDKQSLMKNIAQSRNNPISQNKERKNTSRGAAYLLGRKAEEEAKDQVTAKLSLITETIFQDLAKCAFDVKINNTLSQRLTKKKKDMILNAVFLVEREKVAHFCQQEKKFMEHYASMGIDLELSGPWPPYNFTEGSYDEEPAEQSQ